MCAHPHPSPQFVPRSQCVAISPFPYPRLDPEPVPGDTSTWDQPTECTFVQHAVPITLPRSNWSVVFTISQFRQRPEIVLSPLP